MKSVFVFDLVLVKQTLLCEKGRWPRQTAPIHTKPAQCSLHSPIHLSDIFCSWPISSDKNLCPPPSTLVKKKEKKCVEIARLNIFLQGIKLIDRREWWCFFFPLSFSFWKAFTSVLQIVNSSLNAVELD